MGVKTIVLMASPGSKKGMDGPKNPGTLSILACAHRREQNTVKYQGLKPLSIYSHQVTGVRSLYLVLDMHTHSDFVVSFVLSFVKISRGEWS